MTVLLRGLIVSGLLTAGIAVGRYTIPVRVVGPGPASEPVATVAEGPAPRSWEATVYLPLADNGGIPFSEEKWGEALEVFVTNFGGATLGEPREGCWLDARRRVRREQVRPVVVSFGPHRLDEFRLAVRDVGKRLDQEAMYIRFDEPRVEVIPVVTARPGGDR